MFEEQSYESILERMLNRIPSDMDKREGSIIYDALAPEALEIARIYVQLDSILSLVFAKTTYGQYLDYLAESHGVERKLAEKALGKVNIVGTPDFYIQKPVEITLVINDSSLKFTVVDENKNPIDLVIPSTGKCESYLLCNTAGTIGNISANSIEFYEFVPGVDSISNSEAFEGGMEEETDTSLLQRLLEKVKNPPSSGNKNDYIRWAKEISGVDNVKVIPLWDGPGTVKLIIYDYKGFPLSSELINKVKDYIAPEDLSKEGKAPLGAHVTVLTVKLKNLTVNIRGLVVQQGYTLMSVKEAIDKNVKSHLESIAPGDTVIIKACGAVVMKTDGVMDFDSISINGTNSNITTSDEEKVVLDGVTYE